MPRESASAPSAAACREAEALLRSGRAASAERALRAALEERPDEPRCLGLLGAALLAQDRVGEAIALLEAALERAPGLDDTRVELARAYRAAGGLEPARSEIRRVLARQPRLPRAWLAYGDVLVDLGQPNDARFAYEQARLFDPELARITQAGDALAAGDRRGAELAFREVLRRDPSHVGALCGLAAASLAAGAHRDAERLLRHALTQSAYLPLARRGLAQVLLDGGRLAEAEAVSKELLSLEADNPHNWTTLGTIQTRLMRQEEAIDAFAEAARLNPTQVRLPLSLGHLYKTLGRRAESEAAYHACLRVEPGFGEAYWSLADLKDYVFTDQEVGAMRALLATGAGTPTNRSQLDFALGRALEQRGEYREAFAHYASGNALRRREVPFDIAKFEAKSHRVMAAFDSGFFASRAGSGCADPAPIFVVGLPRSGSTLIEQILASHPLVEGTMELPNILTLVREFDAAGQGHDGYPETVCSANPAVLVGLGERYLEETRAIRGGRAHFIDKMPNNFSHVGLIHAILPEAIIIDARRHPLDACFSAYKQYFAEGQAFSYDLNDLGRYYRCYLELIDHWQRVLPGRVLTVRYEAVVRDPETEIRRLLAHCRLPFDAACLRFHETKRAVRTASSEQVRRPLYSSGVGYWKHFEQELAPLKASLGDALARFREAD